MKKFFLGLVISLASLSINAQQTVNLPVDCYDKATVNRQLKEMNMKLLVEFTNDGLKGFIVGNSQSGQVMVFYVNDTVACLVAGGKVIRAGV